MESFVLRFVKEFKENCIDKRDQDVIYHTKVILDVKLRSLCYKSKTRISNPRFVEWRCCPPIMKLFTSLVLTIDHATVPESILDSHFLNYIELLHKLYGKLSKGKGEEKMQVTNKNWTLFTNNRWVQVKVQLSALLKYAKIFPRDHENEPFPSAVSLPACHDYGALHINDLLILFEQRNAL